MTVQVSIKTNGRVYWEVSLYGHISHSGVTSIIQSTYDSHRFCIFNVINLLSGTSWTIHRIEIETDNKRASLINTEMLLTDKVCKKALQSIASRAKISEYSIVSISHKKQTVIA